jgi:hypothetical protein
VEGVTFIETLQQLRASLANRYLEDETLLPPIGWVTNGSSRWGDWLGNGKIAPGQHRTFTEARVRPEPSPTCLDRYLANDVHQIVFLVAAAVLRDPLFVGGEPF